MFTMIAIAFVGSAVGMVLLMLFFGFQEWRKDREEHRDPSAAQAVAKPAPTSAP